MIVLARCSVESLHGTSRAQMFGPDFSAHAADTHIVEGLSSPRDAGRLCRTAILHVHWDRVADACGKGPGAPSVGQSYWPFMRTSSWGCLVFDVIIAIWFLAGAPALVGHGTKTPADGVTLSGRLATVGTEWKSSCGSHINGRAPEMRISTSLRALCCQSGLVETFDTPIRARRRSIGSRSLRMSALLTARFTRAPIAYQT